MSETYVKQVLAGDAVWTDIEEFVERWHRGGDDQPISEFLGMTPEEYKLWVEQPRSLRFILAAHKREKPVERLFSQPEELAVAARGLDEKDAEIVRAWLVKTGRLPEN